MADNGARLVATLEARVNKFERDLAKANGTARREFGAIEKRSQQMANRLATTVSSAATRAQGALKGLASSFAGGFLGGFAAGGVQGFVSEIRNATRSMAELKAEAAKAGVGVEAFQSLGYAARQNNVSVDALTDGLKELQLRADEFIVTGKGSGAEAFARLGYGADELKAKLRDPSALFVEIIGRLQRLGDTAAQIRIADEIFGGTGGEQFVRFLEQGEAGIRRNIEEAKRLGVVLDEDVVKKGAELDREFQKIADTIGSNIKNAVVSVATSLATWGTNVEGFLNSLGNSSFFKTLNDWTSMPTPGVTMLTPGQTPAAGGLDPKATDQLRAAMIAAGTTARASVPDRAQQLPGTFVDQKLAGLSTDFRASLAKMILAAREAGHDIKIQSGFRSVERQQELWAAAVRKYGSEDAARKWVAPPGRSYHNKGTAADLNYSGGGMTPGSDNGRAARLWAQQNASRFGLTFPLGNEPWHVEPQGQRGQPAMGDPDTPDAPNASGEASTKRGAVARTEAQMAADKQAEAVKRVMDALALETAQLGQTEAKQRVLQELQAAGVNIASAEGQAIQAKIARLHELKTAQEAVTASAEATAERSRKAREEMAGLGAEATKGIVADLRNGVSAADAFASALDRIATRLLDMAIDQAFASLFGAGGAGGGGLFGGLLGGIFGGGRAKGGALRAGKVHLVGEEGPELVRGAGTVIPAPQSAALLQARPAVPSATTFAPSVNVSTAPMQVTVINNSSARVETKEREDRRGGRRTEIVMNEAVAETIAKRGATSQAMEENLYTRRRVPRR